MEKASERDTRPVAQLTPPLGKLKRDAKPPTFLQAFITEQRYTQNQNTAATKITNREDKIDHPT